MTTTHTVNGVAMRENSVGTAILLSIITLGIYWLVLVYRNTMDIHRAAGKETTMAVILFIASIFVPLLWFALFSLNGIYLNELREQKRQDTDMTWLIALVLHLVVAFVGSIVWAVHYDHTIQALGQSA